MKRGRPLFTFKPLAVTFSAPERKFSNWDTRITSKISKFEFPSYYTCETKPSTIYVKAFGEFVKPNSIEERLKCENAKTFISPQLWKEAGHKLQTAGKVVKPGLDQQLILIKNRVTERILTTRFSNSHKSKLSQSQTKPETLSMSKYIY